MSKSIQKRGSFLVLTADAEQTQAQLAGHRYTAEQAADQSLHYGVNTDAMISGQACTLGYTGEILGPYFLENFQEVVKLESIQKNDFQIVVGGDAYGTGSSREVAVVAHQGALRHRRRRCWLVQAV